MERELQGSLRRFRIRGWVPCHLEPVWLLDPLPLQRPEAGWVRLERLPDLDQLGQGVGGGTGVRRQQRMPAVEQPFRHPVQAGACTALVFFTSYIRLHVSVRGDVSPICR